ncbi:DUF4359 domain-containing protein [Methylomicrobium sp. Wu6]|uniref:DUF4359 domain-containing protein n=1 Tax=Methylomicrobium sp. Wu6 TaxID=3107928 RepID=UPI002DD62B0B|nr:DUF4359 domain-containing protein [Methylomicrobium sp. Wu6]MEC4750188.1 DUF4359 domain-containing protein [Methylomicrobium sp. Wu6]
MKLLASTLILIAFLGFLAYTNPKMDSYDRFINQRILEKTQKAKDPLQGMIGSVLGGFASRLMVQQTERKDYIIFSTYDTPIGNQHIRAIGILNHFYLTEDQVFENQVSQSP